MMKLRELIRNQKGFTLIELVFVVIILAILAGVAIVNLGSTEDDAKAAKEKADLRILATAVKVYKVKTSDFPDSLADLATVSGSYKPMIDDVPVDADGDAYTFAATATQVTITGGSGEQVVVK